MSVVKDEATRQELSRIAKEYQEDMVAERGEDIEAEVLHAIRSLTNQTSNHITVKDIARVVESRSDEYGRTVTPKWIGTILRKRLKIKTTRNRGIYIVPSAEYAKLERLYQRYGVSQSVEKENGTPPDNLPVGDLVDFEDLWGR